MMAVNMSGIDKNPFRVGDKVKVKMRILRAWPRAFKKYLHVQYAVVTKLNNTHVFTDVDSDPINFEHFELYKESCNNPEAVIMNKPDTQQKTKRVPFTHELWKKWKDKGGKVLYANGPHIIKDMVCFDNAVTTYRYAGYCEERDCIYVCEGDDFSLEIPVTTKRIPFNPELKDAKVFVKVFYGDTEMVEWVQMKSGVVCGSYDAGGFAGVITNLYHPNDLQMEIEE